MSALIGLVLGLLGQPLLQMSPHWRSTQYYLNKKMPNLIPDVATLINFRLRGLDTEEQYFEAMKSLGYSKEIASKIYETAKNLYDTTNAIQLYYRKLITKDELYSELEKIGWDKQHIDKLVELAKPLPSVSDLIMWMVRDVFREKTVEKYGYDEGFEEIKDALMQWAGKLGLDENTMKYYWRAHWALPSFTEGIYMHRKIIPLEEGAEEPLEITINGKQYGRVISKETLEELLKIADIPPYWRKKLMQLVYVTPTRVDVRRMYRLGVIDRDYVKKLYLELGYREEDAEALTEYAIKDALASYRDLTKSQILTAYEIGELSREQAKEKLIDIGYMEEDAELIITLHDHEIAYKSVQEIINLYIKRYAYGLLSKDELFALLSKLPISSNTLNYYLAKADRERLGRIRTPTKEELARWLVKGYIDVQTYINKMRGLGYSDDDIAIYLHEICDELEEK